jgi:eukaryotic-like serine/threonine-protein kinase
MSGNDPNRGKSQGHDHDTGDDQDAPTRALSVALDQLPAEDGSELTTEQLQPGQILGPYKLVRLLGSGGMGAVWLAKQTEPVVREVALKLIDGKLLSSSGTARFQVEQQMLAQMSHPAIAHVYDAGTTDRGFPWLAMEFVPGQSITKYCDETRLSTLQRLALFIRVCHGVQHAHQKGVLHRDLKPDNILVTEVDGRPVPKIIDFGIAVTSDTESGHRSVAGTPQYMSPEQADKDGLVDTRSDIYSLGVILFEMLTSRPALPSDLFTSFEQKEVWRILRQHRPTAPSSLLTSTGTDAEDIARRQQTSARRLARKLRGELDWIVLRATHAEPEQRYPSAQALALDVQRHLDHQPVSAVPGGRIYRMRRFIRRHRAGVAAASVALTALLGGLVAALLAMTEAQQARAEAERHRAELTEVVEFQQRMIADLDPQAMGINIIEVMVEQLTDEDEQSAQLRTRLTQIGGTEVARQVLIDQMLSPAARALEGGGMSASIQPPLRLTLGEAYQMAGELEQARDQYRQAWQQRAETLGTDHPDTLTKAYRLADALIELGRFDEARPLLEDTIDRMRRVHGADAVDTLMAERKLAWLELELGNAQVALEQLEQVHDGLAAAPDADREDVFHTRMEMALALHSLGQVQQALAESQDVIDQLLADVDTPNSDHAELLSAHAFFLSEAGEIAQSIALGRQVLELERQRLGSRHPDVAVAMNNLAADLIEIDELEEAIALFEQSLEIIQMTFGAHHHHSILMKNNISATYNRMDETEKALALSGEVVELSRKGLGPDHPSTLFYEINWSIDLREAGEIEHAITQLSDTRQRAIDSLGEDHPYTLVATNRLATILDQEGRGDEARALIGNLLEQKLDVFGPHHSDFINTAILVAELNLADHPQRARQIFDEHLAWLLAAEETELAEHGLLSYRDEALQLHELLDDNQT